ncbi:glycoside hydrolase family 43 protein [Roseateles oligotrophus]|uniref:Glycoside hydrolase family 43 protein n=1 Tax=Roseateles oligotrophus TaxID=1769250 RepID=A0ABT2YHQ6_9BURK|nr:glycoside hydrolase family 43 protein [Roseateles oligotrophus]MCV2369584.1 glycoside hydrolase family 43 protein [Roseateles oligotrophus]
MTTNQLRRQFVLASSAAATLGLVACGGGGGSEAAAPAPAPTPAPAPAPSPAPAPATQAPLSFANTAVHDPSVIRVDGVYYVFGSHLAAAKSTDLMNWTKLADGVNDANPLFNKVSTALADTFAWTTVTGLWAADVAKLDDGKYYFYYNSCKGDSPRSALGVAVADKVEGPYVNKQIILRSGMWGLASEDGTVYDALKHPNVVDPNVFRDADGKLWMVYGSYSGGIFVLAMDGSSGLPVAGQGYGKHLMGGNHSRIEGPYVLYSPVSKYYYLFTSFGGLDANGAYNLRLARSLKPDGPYLDAAGKDMAAVKSDPAKPLFDDASIAPHGQKLMGNHQFALASGESGTALGYVSPGHNSAYYDAVTGQYFLIFHTRFPGTGEAHEIRVHEMFLNEDGWLVVAPFRYAPLSLATPAQTAAVSSAEAAGSYKMINHGKDISATLKPSSAIKLSGDGTVSGAVSGSWLHKGSNKLTITLSTGGSFSGVLSRQWNSNAGAFVVSFTAQSAEGMSIWGARTGE